MKLSQTLLLTVALGACVSTARLHAQDKQDKQDKDDPFGSQSEDADVEAPEGPAGSATKAITIYLNKPVEITERVQENPPAGSPLPRRDFEEKVFRDSRGRTRIEVHLPNARTRITINDVVAQKRYHWREGKDDVATTDLPPIHEHHDTTRPLPPDAPVVAGLPTIAHHTASSTKADTTLDTWFSPEVGFYMKRVLHSPMRGDTTYTVTKVKREEPNPKLFVPPGLK